MTIDSRRLVGLLAADERRRVVAALILSETPVSAPVVADRAGVDLRTAVDALARLREVVDCADGRYAIDGSVFARAARAEAPAPPASPFGDQPDSIARVLDGAFRDERLVHFPTKRSKRLIVLDHLAQRFEIGNRYSEAEVNELLRPADDDVAMLRRWLVDEQFLDRSGGMYWRCGGTV